jgi:hypothetical protein
MSARRCAITIVALATVSAIVWTPPYPQAQERRRRERLEERGRDFLRQEQQIRRSRHVTRRVLRDRRASPEMKQQATELQALLDRRETELAGLAARHKEFLARHEAEIDELEDLRKRARELDQRLSTARSELLKASEAEITALKLGSARASELVEALRQAYVQRRRDRRLR